MPGHQRETNFRFPFAQPTDVNFGGKVHGGMKSRNWIDQASYAGAVA